MIPSVPATLLLAHDEGGLGDAGLSPALVLYVSVAMLVLVAVALRSTWTSARFGPLAGGAADDDDRPVRGAAIAGRAVALALLALLLLVAFGGSPTPGANLAPVAVFSAFWYGGLLVSLLVGDVWSAVHPVATVVETIDRVLGRDRGMEATSEPARSPAPARSTASIGAGEDGAPNQPYGIGLSEPDDRGEGSPEGTGGRGTEESSAESPPDDVADRGSWWVPAALLTGFAVLWICWPGGLRPRPTGTFLVVWLAVLLAGGVARGPAWVRDHDPFALLFSAVAACSPVRWARGRPALSSPARHLAARTGSGDGSRAAATAAILAVALGATIFDGFRVTRTWTDLVGPRSLTSLGVLNTVGLVWIILIVAAAWMLVARSLDRSAGGDDPLPLAVAFAPSLAAVVVADRLAHGLERFLLAGQNLVSLASDPFANGADLFGTVDWVDHPILSATALAWVGLVLLLAGQLVALVVLHDRTVARFGPTVAARAVWPATAFLTASLVVALRLFGL